MQPERCAPRIVTEAKALDVELVVNTHVVGGATRCLVVRGCLKYFRRERSQAWCVLKFMHLSIDMDVQTRCVGAALETPP